MTLNCYFDFCELQFNYIWIFDLRKKKTLILSVGRFLFNVMFCNLLYYTYRKIRKLFKLKFVLNLKVENSLRFDRMKIKHSFHPFFHAKRRIFGICLLKHLHLKHIKKISIWRNLTLGQRKSLKFCCFLLLLIPSCA